MMSWDLVGIVAGFYWVLRWYVNLLDSCHRPPSYVPYKCTFGMPDQGQMLDL
jgi:hypothetical protein